MRKVLIIGLLFTFGLALASCGEEAPKPIPKKKKVATHKPAAPAAEEPAVGKEESTKPKVAELKPADSILQLRDPFRSYLTDALQGRGNIAFTEREGESPLQQFDVNQFTVRGIVFGVTIPTAIIQDPTGKTHMIKVGTIIGKHWGKVIKIKKNEVVVHEELLDPSTGQRRSREISLPLVVSTISKLNPMQNEAGEGQQQEQQKSSAGASSAEDDRIKRFESILNTQETYQKFWQPAPTTVPGGLK